MDVLDDILGSLRLSGGVVIDGKFTGDYCVRAQFTPDHCAPWFPMPGTLIAYHYVRSGRTIAQVDGLDPVSVDAGSIIILPRNDPHLLTSRLGVPAADVGEIGWVTADGVHRVSSGTPGEKTEVWCGFLGTRLGTRHPLMDALPAMLTLNAAKHEAQWLDSSLRFLAAGNASPEMIARLSELFLAQAIRDYVENLPDSSSGWLRGLADPATSRALSIIHNRYAEEIDVEMLAREAGVSRTVLGERFASLIGESPMRYCARWRMRMASNLLRDGRQTSGSIAYAVGFNSEAAFNRAFKREYGAPPATWRKRAAVVEFQPA
ncbi:AraC family transcriptional regulator [Sphingomonas sp.]|uniref:AraC family transcriptional regulator n=1 Tax=Sphingomonas sp. TaxID=28214 RepID=UPI0038B08CF1